MQSLLWSPLTQLGNRRLGNLAMAPACGLMGVSLGLSAQLRPASKGERYFHCSQGMLGRWGLGVGRHEQ